MSQPEHKRAGRSRPEGVVRALPLSFRDDAALVRAAVDGHPAAARAIWEQHAATVRGLLQRTMGPGEVDDLVQETFLRFFRLAQRLRDPGKLRSFLVGIAMRVAREQLRWRRARRWLTLSADGTLPEQPAPSLDLDSAEALRRLYAILDRVDPNARLVFVLRFVEQISTTEIAEVLGCSLATAKRRAARARTRIWRLAERDPALAAFVRHTGPSAGEGGSDHGTGGRDE